MGLEAGRACGQVDAELAAVETARHHVDEELARRPANSRQSAKSQSAVTTSQVFGSSPAVSQNNGSARGPEAHGSSPPGSGKIGYGIRSGGLVRETAASDRT